MPEFLPFRGIHYQPGVIGDISQVVAPPYDVIDPDLHSRLLAASSWNCVRLDLGETPGKLGDYEEGARRLDRWLSEGILAADPSPRFYLVEDAFTLAGEETPRRRWGVIGRMRLEPLESGRIHPHERTHAGPKQDRLRHLRAFRGNLSCVFSLFDGDAAVVRRALSPIFAAEPFAAFTDRDGVGRRMWMVDSPGVMEDLSDLLSDRDYYIADGHHRYETALAYARERAAADPSPYPEAGYHYVMMALVGMGDPGLAILPTHRLLHGFPRFGMEKLLSCAEEAFLLEKPSPEEERELAVGSVPSLPGRGFFLYDPSTGALHRALLRGDFDLARALPDLPAQVRSLPATLAERLLMMRCLGLTAEQISHKEHLEYVQGTAETMAGARARSQAAIILPPPRMEDLVAVTGAGERMPQKSTFFYPKLLTGLVFYRHDL